MRFQYSHIFILVFYALGWLSTHGCQTDDTASQPPTNDSGQLDGVGDADLETDVAISPVPDNLIDEWTYLIVTTEEMAPAFEDLVEWRRQTGLPAQLVTMDEVTTVAAGRDSAEQLRNYLQEVFEERQTEIVLLGGDTPMVPHRDVHAYAAVEEAFETSAVTPSELYFSDLDGDWDGDSDGTYGEFEDGLDMVPDVAIGRVPARTLSDATAYVQKVRDYEQAIESDYQNQVLYLAEPTGWFDLSPCAMLELWTGQLFGSDQEIQRLYDDLDQCPSGELNTVESQMAALNQGVGMVVHLGHGSEEYMAYMTSSQVESLTNSPRFNVVFSCACDTGNFDRSGSQSAGERFVLDSDGGGVGYVGNTDIGIGFPPGAFFVKEVIEQLLQADPPRLGEAFANSRMNFFAGGGHSWDDGHPDRYTQFVVVLLGDPGIRMWQTLPRPIHLSAPERMGVDSPLSLTVVDDDEAPVSGATLTLYQPDTLLLIRTTDPDGRVTVETTGARTGDLIVTASGANFIPAQSVVVVE